LDESRKLINDFLFNRRGQKWNFYILFYLYY
jgi:hypothetical protein